MKTRIFKSRNDRWVTVQGKGFESRIQFFNTWPEAIDWVMNSQKYYWGIERLEHRW